MSWKIAIVVALLTAVLTAIITAPVADHVTKKMKVSNMEGGRAYLVIFLIGAGLLGGGVIGVIATMVVGAMEWGQFWKAEGVALLFSNAALFSIAGLCLLSVPKPLRMDGQLVALDIEVFVPEANGPVGKPSKKNLYMSLYANNDDNRYVEIDHGRVRHVEGMFVIQAEAALNTVSHNRMLSLTINDSIGYTLDMPLVPVPRKKDLEWTDRMRTRLSKVTDTTYEYTDVLVRYRVVKKEKADRA